MQLTIQQIKDAFTAKDYVFFPEDTPYNVTVWGIRTRFDKTNLFDDAPRWV